MRFDLHGKALQGPNTTLSCGKQPYFIVLQMQSKILSLEEEKTALEAKVAEGCEQLQAAAEQHKLLSKQMQEVTESFQQKGRDEATKADERLSELQVRTHV